MAKKLLVTLDAQGGPTAQMVELTAAELAQQTADADGQVVTATATRTRTARQLVARCDHYLAQTDWIMLPAAARPVDYSSALTASLDANRELWRQWRADVRAYRAQVIAGTVDPYSPAALPAQPSEPAVILS